jgi:hypothetical protein
MATKLGKMAADFRTTLATEIAVSGTGGTLQSYADSDGNNLPNGTYYFTLDKESSQKEHIVCTLTAGVMSAISTVSRQGVQASGVVRKHRIGASVEITDFAHIMYMNDLLAGTTNLNASVPLAYDGVATLTPGSNQLCTVAYADALSFAGAPNGSTTQKGLFEGSTGSELAAGTGTGGTGALLVPLTSSFTNTSAGAGDVNKVPVLNAAGQLAEGFVQSASTTVAGKAELATGAETAAGTATGGAGPLVPANSSFTATSSGAADVNKVAVLGSAGTIADGFGYTTVTAGETVTAGQGAYAKAADSRAWKSQGTTDEATFNFIGVFADAGNAGDTVRLVPPGGVLTTTGLTAGAYYFVSDTAGTLATTPGTRFARVGLALSTTRLLVLVPKYKVSSTQNIGSATTFVQTTGFYPARITVRAASTSIGVAGGSIGDDTNTCIAFRLLGANNDANARGGEAWYVYDRSAETLKSAGTITSLTATGFTLSCSTYVSTVSIQWTAESL